MSGWYADPWGEAPLRWWDGTAWTGGTLDPAARRRRELAIVANVALVTLAVVTILVGAQFVIGHAGPACDPSSCPSTVTWNNAVHDAPSLFGILVAFDAAVLALGAYTRQRSPGAVAAIALTCVMLTPFVWGAIWILDGLARAMTASM